MVGTTGEQTGPLMGWKMAKRRVASLVVLMEMRLVEKMEIHSVD